MCSYGFRTNLFLYHPVLYCCNYNSFRQKEYVTPSVTGRRQWRRPFMFADGSHACRDLLSPWHCV